MENTEKVLEVPADVDAEEKENIETPGESPKGGADMKNPEEKSEEVLAGE